MIQDCTYLNQTTNLRLFLHDTFYSREEVIGEILNTIPNYFDVFSINYIPDTRSIKIKIKKTNMKKNDSNYNHNTTYYYQIMNELFLNVFQSNWNFISNLLLANMKKYSLRGDEMKYLSDINTISSVYNMTTLLDNVIIINL